MKEYIAGLRERLLSTTQKLPTLGSAEEACVYADAIYKLEMLNKCSHEERETCEFDRATALRWTTDMQNADGTTGAHWTMEQTAAIADSMGIEQDSIPRWVWGVTMNMMYSDYYNVAVEFDNNRPEFYASLAKAFLFDKDGPGPEKKLIEYYEHIAKNA